MESEATCWTLIEEAAGGAGEARELFARRYLPVVRAYLLARWRKRLRPEEIEDAAQEIFVECLKEEGLLERVRRGERAGFRGFLFAACRNVALRVEERRFRQPALGRREPLPEDKILADDETIGSAFDQAWAKALLKEAAARQAELAADKGENAKKRVELLRLRFREGLPIRDIAKRWDVDSAWVHHQYAQATKEFEGALREVLQFHNPGQPEAVARELRELSALLG